ncbi:hypothetical protein AVEN_52294-1, partial [Araneus ventricosus]
KHILFTGSSFYCALAATSRWTLTECTTLLPTTAADNQFPGLN